MLLVPALSARVEAPLSRLARFGPKTRGNGFWTGVGVGAALGFVCAPVRGPDPGGGHLRQRLATGLTVRIVLVRVLVRRSG